MLNSLINRSQDLAALVEVGYRVKIRGAYLIVEQIPYITEKGEIELASLVTDLNLSGPEGEQSTCTPDNHTVWWTGGMPHDIAGESMESYLCCGKWSEGRDIGEGIIAYAQWSRKPYEGGKTRAYSDYKEKMEAYVREVGGQAEAKQPGCIEAATRGWEPDIELSTRFEYINTGPYRNGTKGIEKRIEDEVVAVVGVGGSGSYLVDILAKTDIKELHLYDSDVMETHNAFRVAGAARVGELGCGKYKVDWHKERYEVVRKNGLHSHHFEINDTNSEKLKSCTTVFIAVDDLQIRREIQRACNQMGVEHFSVGIGMEIEGEHNDQIGGNVKVEANYQVPECGDDTKSKSPVGADDDVEDVYRDNIQTVELNMLGAALAIIEWKARRGIYRNERDTGVDSVIYSSTTGKIQVARKGAEDSE